MCRNGDRNIIATYPNDRWNREAFAPEGLGQLTKLGKQQQYQLGQYFRKRYGSLIGDGEYSPKTVYIESTVKKLKSVFGANL